jgi:hypothetical protein
MRSNLAPPVRWDGPALDDLQTACTRALEWVHAQQRSDGALGDPADGFMVHRAPWAFALMGETRSAHAMCAWIRANLLREGRLDGELRILDDGYAYRDSTLIIGAHMLEQYDLSLGVLPHLLSWQDPVTGGFANDRQPDGSPSDEMDIPYACGPGFAALITGNIVAAKRVADFLQLAYDAQPELPGRFYGFWSRRNQRLIMPSDPEFEDRFVVINDEDKMQRWTIGGIAAGFLGRLYLAEPRSEYLALARRYQEFSMQASDAQFKYPSVCKSSWGAALLYQITGETQYLHWLERMAQWYLTGQEADGYWHPWIENSTGDVLQITLEYIVHMQTIIGAVASRSLSTA